jgi:uncharacterized protein
MSSGAPWITPQPHIGFGQVRHKRLRPRVHGFAYPTFFLMLPMRSWSSEAGQASNLARNRFAPISFFDRDHGDGRANATQWLDALLQDAGITDADGEAWLHTYPRMWGHTFKPVSFWYCERADGSLRAIVAEVNNTFGERHCYLLDHADGSALREGELLQARKVFHVSPFCATEGSYEFRLMRSSAAKPRTVVRVDHFDANGPLIQTSVSGELTLADPAALRRAAWGYPLHTLAVVARIHWHALRLALKRVPFFRKPQAPEQFATR